MRRLQEVDRLAVDSEQGMAEVEKEWLLMVDGAARGNPGEAGCGAAICDETARL